MALSTTQSIWRSGGGDQTRTAYCGSGVMAATFYVANAATNTAAVKVSNAAGAPSLILPAGAVILSVSITNPTTAGAIDLGFTTYTSGAASPDGLMNGFTANAATTALPGSTNAAGLGTVMSATEMVYITQRDGGSASGDVGGIITYYVTDPLSGQQNV